MNRKSALACVFAAAACSTAGCAYDSLGADEGSTDEQGAAFSQAAVQAVSGTMQDFIISRDGTRFSVSGTSGLSITKVDAAGKLLASSSLSGAIKPRRVVESESGEIYVAAEFTGPVSYGAMMVATASNTDVLLVRFSRALSLIGVRQLVGTGADAIHSLEVRGDSVLIAGTFESSLAVGSLKLTSAGSTDGFIADLSLSLAPKWARAFGGAGKETLFAGRDATGRIFAAGTYDASKSFSVDGFVVKATSPASQEDIFALALDSSGKTVWAKGYNAGAYSAQKATAFAVHQDGGFFVGGYNNGTVFFGNDTSATGNASQGFIARLDANGVGVWATDIGPASTDGCDMKLARIIPSSTGEVSLVGNVRNATGGAKCYVGNSPLTQSSQAYLLQIDNVGSYKDVWLAPSTVGTTGVTAVRMQSGTHFVGTFDSAATKSYLTALSQ